MVRITLPTAQELAAVKSPSRPKPQGYKPAFNQADCRRMAFHIMEVMSLPEAGDVTKRYLRQRTLTKGWKFYFRRLANVFEQGKPGLAIFLPDGNSKLPFYTFSTLPMFTCPGMGDCGHWCYSLRSWRYPGAFARQVQNTMFIRWRPDIIEEAFYKIPKRQTLRLYVDGDFDSETSFVFWMRLLAQRPDILAYSYSKSWDLIKAAASVVPSNYVLNLSDGGRPQHTSAAEMLKLPFVRGWFKTVEIDMKQWGKPNPGYARYADPEYHSRVQDAAKALGDQETVSCPGLCGGCLACGDMSLRGVTIVNGRH